MGRVDKGVRVGITKELTGNHLDQGQLNGDTDHRAKVVDFESLSITSLLNRSDDVSLKAT